ncbi:MAG: flagellar protein FlaG [Deltaproteobacteria bacterium]|nr:flagellar protein FlaG [Deltaproteobacteria bacterium]MBW2302307.1 flagellar protein FlaG [Deltaproteobacteria bacterium]
MEAVGSIKSSEIGQAEAVLKTGPEGLDTRRGTSSTASKVQSSDELKNTAVSEETKGKIERIAEAMDKYLKSMQTNLKIQVHKPTGCIIIKVLSGDGKVIREIPPEEMLNLAAKMEEMTGLFFNENV